MGLSAPTFDIDDHFSIARYLCLAQFDTYPAHARAVHTYWVYRLQTLKVDVALDSFRGLCGLKQLHS